MKNKFHGHYRPTDSEFDLIWKESLVVLDANVLLNLYSYSESTSSEILTLLEEFNDRLWLPYKVAEEYHIKRISIIEREVNEYCKIATDLETISIALKSEKCHPFVDINVLEEFYSIVIEVKKALNKGKEKQKSLVGNDLICDKLSQIFNGRVGDQLSEEELTKTYKEGKARYETKIPPGFEDDKKPEPGKYGDLVIWFEMINKASSEKMSIIFVTDDTKSDWWKIVNNNKIGPRPELRHEFRNKTERDFYIYSTESFVETAKKYGNRISESAVKEIEVTSKLRAQEQSKLNSILSSVDQIKAHEQSNLKSILSSVDLIKAQEQSKFNSILSSVDQIKAHEQSNLKSILSSVDLIKAQEQSRLDSILNPLDSILKPSVTDLLRAQGLSRLDEDDLDN